MPKMYIFIAYIFVCKCTGICGKIHMQNYVELHKETYENIGKNDTHLLAR